jgi:hypothetical protein
MSARPRILLGMDGSSKTHQVCHGALGRHLEDCANPVCAPKVSCSVEIAVTPPDRGAR